MRLGYGEMLVGMSTFVEAYFEDQRENMEEEDGDDNFEVDKFAKCEEYDPDENADDANQGAWENYQFFVGPTCTEDELGLKLELFTDQYCTQVSETSFETISNGWTLPYSSGGLVSTYCSSCTEYDDDGDAESENCAWNLTRWQHTNAKKEWNIIATMDRTTKVAKLSRKCPPPQKVLVEERS